MTEQFGFCEDLMTFAALQITFVLVNLHVFVEIALLRERLLATVYWANIGALLCVRAQVVKEVVPFPERTFAVLMLAEEYLAPSFAI